MTSLKFCYLKQYKDEQQGWRNIFYFGGLNLKKIIVVFDQVETQAA